MKKLTLVFIAVAFAFNAMAQNKIEVKESNENFSSGSQNALSVIVYGGEADAVEKAWKKQLKDLKGSVKSKDEIFADDCRIKKMSSNTFDVYAKIEPVDDGVRLIAAYDLGGAYLTSKEHKDEFSFIKDMMYKFGVSATKAAIGDVIKAEKKLLDGLSDEKSDLEKEMEDYKKNIESYKKKIEENEKKIAETNETIAAKKAEIKTQEEVVKAAESKQKAVK